MTDFYASQTGAGAMNGTTVADAWPIASVTWASLVQNTLYILDTVRGFTIGANNGSTGTMTIRGDYPARPGIIDGDSIDTKLINFSTPGRQNYLVESLTFTGLFSDASSSAIHINSQTNVTVQNCTFLGDGVTVARGIYILCPSTSNFTNNIQILNNTFTDWSPITPLGAEGACIHMLANITDTNAPVGIIVSGNTATNCNYFYRNPLSSQTTFDNQYFPKGVQITGNTITDCERAIQQVHWVDGSGANLSFISNNVITNTGTAGPVGVGNTAMNVIQCEGVKGGYIADNIINGWEKENDNGDGCAVILDWGNASPGVYCEDVAVYGNTILNGLLTVTDAFTLGGINFYRAKNCIAYDNIIVDCRCAFSSGGDPADPSRYTGNRIHNNLVIGTLAEANRFGSDGVEIEYRNNAFINCHSLSTTAGTGAAPDWDYNAYYNCGTPVYTGANDVTDDPGALYNYRLGEDSPLVDAGDASVLPLDDFEGVAFRSPPCIGVYAVPTSLICLNTDPSTQDVNYNGVWTTDDWATIANNTRYYPINEGLGTVLRCYDAYGVGVSVPANDATLQGSDIPDGW